MSEIEEIKRQIVKQAVKLNVGGFKPTNSMTESWIGKVYLYGLEEEIPLDKNGALMIPVLQLCLENLPFVPKILSKTKVITVFISEELPFETTQNGDGWELREYSIEDELLKKDLKHSASKLKPFALKPALLNEDYPVWDGGGLSSHMEDKIIKLEESGIIENYYDIFENQYGHKIGGYPSFCQPGIDFGENYEFTLQIASDEKLNLNIVDGGTIFLAKNKMTKKWKFYCDFY